MSDERPGRAVRVYGALVSVILVGAVLGVAALVAWWGGGVAQSGEGISMPEVLLTAASLFILIFSVLVGLGAAFGWRGLRDLTAYRVRQEVESDMQDVRRDSKMHVNTTRAFIYQKRSYRKYPPGREETIRVTDEKLLNEAITTLESVLDDAPEGHEKVGLVANNLAFLLAVRAQEKDAKRAIGLAHDLRNRHYVEWDDHAVINTWARVIAVFHEQCELPREKLERAAADLKWVISDENCPKGEHENARRHLQEVRRALQQL